MTACCQLDSSLPSDGEVSDDGHGDGRCKANSQATRPRADTNRVLDVEDINALLRKVAENQHDTRFDLNDDGQVDYDDIVVWTHDVMNTWLGDANLDGNLDTSDLVLVFQPGKYERNVEALWSEGDWTGDLRFNSSDFVSILNEFCPDYECGPRPGAALGLG